MSIGVCVITHAAKKHLPKCLTPLLASYLKPKVLVVNSSSHDGTVELAQKMGADTLVIPRKEFNHGMTREVARRAIGTEIVVMITPDAYLIDNFQLEMLIAPLLQGKASACYAKQLPHKGAGFFEAFAREYNYPDKSHTRGIEDKKKWGAYTYFCSNSCSAWLNWALDEVGGFPHVLLGEDTIACAKLLAHGHKIAYQADAKVYHSHSYSLKQEFQRHFDTGLARGAMQELPEENDMGRGKDFAKALLLKTLREKPLLVPYALCHLAAKLTGYKMGRASQKAPVWLKKTLSSQDFYWTD